MAKLLFFDTDHKYTLDGEELPSVSEVTRFISREIYGDIGQFNLDRAAKRGTAVHKATEVLDKYGKVEISEDIEPYIKAYVAFRHEHKCEWKYIERQSYEPQKRYAGTIDRLGALDGVCTLLDIKTTSSISKRHRTLYSVCLTLYRRMFPDADVKQLVILQLKNDGTYRIHRLEPLEELAESCVIMHHALKTAPRKRRKGGESDD